MKIERTTCAWPIHGCKRQRFPYILTDQCPLCERVNTVDLRKEHLDSPEFGVPTKVYFICECGTDWVRYVLPELRLEVCDG